MGNSHISTTPTKTPNFRVTPKAFRNTYKPFYFPNSAAFDRDPNMFCLQGPGDELYILKEVSFSTKEDLALFLENLESVIGIQHPNILKVHNYMTEENRIGDCTVSFTANIIFEFFEYTLQDELAVRRRLNRPFKEAEIQDILNDLVDVLEFLQLKGIRFGDLNPSRIYITSKNKPKLMLLTDLDYSLNIRNSNRNISMSTYSSSSEQKLRLTDDSPTEEKTSTALSSFKQDVYSLGSVIMEMMVRKEANESTDSHYEYIRVNGRVIPCSRTYSSYLHSLLEIMLGPDEEKRPDFMELKRIIQSRNVKANEQAIREGYIDMFGSCFEFFSEPIRACFLEEIMAAQEGNWNGKKNALILEPEQSAFELVPTSTYSREGKVQKGCEEAKDDVQRKTIDYDKMTIETEKELYNVYEEKIMTIRKLTISFMETGTTVQVQRIIGQVIGRQINLKALVLSLPKSKLSGEGLGEICKGIEEASGLTSCYLNFRKTEIEDRDVEVLAVCLGKIQGLTQIVLNLSNNRIKDKGCLEIAECLGNMKNLKVLALNLGRNLVRKEGILGVAKEIGRMQKMENLTVFLNSNEMKGKETVIELVESLQKLGSLEKVSLNLANNLLGDEEVEVLLEYLRRNSTEEISLDLKENPVSVETKRKAKSECSAYNDVGISF